MPYVDDALLSRIRVYLRLRPSVKPSPAINIESETHRVLIDVEKSIGGGPPKAYVNQIVFNVDNIVQASVDEFLKGYNSTIMSYGQVGAGKTFTMTGDMKVYVHRGIIPRAIQQIFEEKEAKPEAGIVVHMSYMEIYQEGLYDLLQKRRDDLMIIEDNQLLNVRGLAKVRVETETEALKWFQEGEKSRSFGNHFLNSLSSRSHTILTFYMERRVARVSTQLALQVAKLNLVDLAGVERLKKTKGDTGSLMRKEACINNKTLSFLEQTIFALRLKKAHIPFRHSKVTTLLKESLGNNHKTVFMVCAWPEEYFLDETIGALRFAQRVKYLKIFQVTHKKPDCADTTRKQQLEIATLKQELALKDALNGRPGLGYDNLTPEVKDKLRSTIQEFLENDKKLGDIPINSIKQVKEIFYLFKESQMKLEIELEKALQQSGISPMKQELHKKEYCVEELLLGEFDDDGVTLNVNQGASKALEPDAIRAGVTMLDYKQGDPFSKIWISSNKLRNEAMKEFKLTVPKVKEYETWIKAKKKQLKRERRCARDLCDKFNEIIREIHVIQSILKEKRGLRDFEMDVDHYKTNLFNRFQTVKGDREKTLNDIKIQKLIVTKISQEIRDCMEMFLKSFYLWYYEHDKFRGKDTEAYLSHLERQVNDSFTHPN
ncbi:kinesin-like protein KLP1 isoform X4 [Physcomitrium patens]|uniref:kinesin-like protein KLP1 isoform X4 n=1 Tax=Physcomitrium patens TaxID=3218 RepID=UPI000D16E583|nr:kinesin-like protein KLP1 isoform X2 [Physcomitrium patens]|eukprot:XP_024372831.1 kinesin-like protein KLP1 isoform X2 [Physcomitrella patens]